ncbi:uncharacterized protein K452DRAFT_322002 [Aplosporella prunicola CBS 121167]|uniref:Peptidase S53 activation domain-containing protein n=1 Tax=Aplosporella prunicola CBS 121167 TaxID=1176127 RepID=A0A6A6AZJ2_9PEZI|nr:uncharacterized protein K452DRAFT_322002 [Aplosporella prunicola CBS 121167]KAF2137066.1 hypothetical protein K452DRAFT_322002 [Aplosporella prunicola CBS 121167]
MRFSIARFAIATALVPAALAAPLGNELAPALETRDPAGGIIHISKNHDASTRISNTPPEARSLEPRGLPIPIHDTITETSQIALLQAWDDLGVSTDEPLDVKSKSAGGSSKEDKVLQSLTGSEDEGVRKLLAPKGAVDAEVEEVKIEPMTGNGVKGSVYYAVS